MQEASNISEHVCVAFHFSSVAEQKYFHAGLIFHLTQQSVSVAKRGCLGKEYREQSKYTHLLPIVNILGNQQFKIFDALGMQRFLKIY